MIETYEVTVVINPEKPKLNRKYTCKGHYFVSDPAVKDSSTGRLVGGGTSCIQTLVLVLKDERKVMIPTNKYIVEFDDGWFRMQKEKFEKETNGHVKLNDGLKNKVT